MLIMATPAAELWVIRAPGLRDEQKNITYTHIIKSASKTENRRG